MTQYLFAGNPAARPRLIPMSIAAATATVFVRWRCCAVRWFRARPKPSLRRR